jgi:serine/threonine protein kinase
VTDFHDLHPATEHVPGNSLEEWFLEDPDGRAALRKHEIIGDVIRALAAAHGQAIYHGNLKPANILPPETAARGFATRGPPPQGPETKITGFGSAGLDATDRGTGQLYVPPEASNAAPDPAGADVFAIGVIWYQLLVGRLERPPYDFAEALRAAGQVSHTIAMISRCLASPGRRFADAVELEREFTGEAPPLWPPVPKGCVDVSQIVREYLSATSK